MHDVMKAPFQTGEETNEYSYLILLAKVKAAQETSIDIAVDATDVRPYPDQPRKYFKPESIALLSQSIDAGGQATKATVRENPGKTRYEIIDGERRWRAIMQIPADRRPLYKASVIDADDDVVRYLISGIANFNREGHTWLETAETIDQHLKFGFPLKVAADMLGLSEIWARDLHGLKRLTPEVQALLDETLPKRKRLPVTAAIQISKIDQSLQENIADRVIKGVVRLPQLRTEVIAVSKREGLPVRVREVDARTQWLSVHSKVREAESLLRDVETLLLSGRLDRFVAMKTQDVVEMERSLVEVGKKVLEIKQLLDTKRT